MTRAEAIEALMIAAACWAENREEQFDRRIMATDTDDQLEQLAGEDDLDDAKLVRDVWLACEVLKAPSPSS
jgi:hypothetical protein